MLGVEVVDPEAPAVSAGEPIVTLAETARPTEEQPRPAAPRLAAAIQRECLRRGLIVELGGRHSSVVRLLPPLTITDEQAAAVLDRLADAVDAVSGGQAGSTSAPQRPSGPGRQGDRAPHTD